ncbi:MAG: PAS domain S-box protein [Rhodoferax sp.]
MLAVFLVGLWSLSFFASQMLRQDMGRLLGEQQFAMVTFVAAAVNRELDDRLVALKTVAQTVSPAMLGQAATMQTLLQERPVLQRLFNGGVIAYRLDGTAIAEVPPSSGRRGVNYMDVEAIAAALRERKSTISRPAMDKTLQAPAFALTVPIHDTQGKLIGALGGVTHLGKPSFLDIITENRYGRTGSYMLVAPQYRLLVTNTGKSHTLETLPGPGTSPFIDRAIQGHEGFGVAVSPYQVEVLASVKGVPVAGWYVAAALPTAEAFAPIHTMQQRMLLATTVLTLLAGVLTWWMIRRQLAPMLAASRTLATLSDTNQPLQALPVTAPDEIGRLIEGFNGLLHTLAQRERALRENEERSRTLLEWSPESIAVHRDGKLIYVNPAAIKMFGAASARDLIGTPLLDRIHPDCHALALTRAKSIAEHGVSTPMIEEKFLKLDGTIINVEVQGTPIAYDGAQAIHMAMHDITGRKQAEEELRIAAIAFECQEGIVVMGANSKILRVNRAFMEITGYTEQEVEGKTTAILRSGRHPASFYDSIRSEAKRTGAWQGELWHRRKNGTDYPARITLTAVRNEKGQVTHYVGNVVDVTSSQLQEQQRLLDETAHRNLLVREVHHRIKNSLQGMMGLLRQFAQNHPEMTEPINQAIGQVQSMSVIHGIQGRAVNASVRLCELTAAIAQEIQALWQTPVLIDIPPGWKPYLIAEKETVPIAVILNELILNAVKHGGKAHGHVSVILRKGDEPDVVRVTICNSGRLRANTDRPTALHNGLQLVDSLMPGDGAHLFREQRGDQVVTLLELTSPLISLEPEEST